MGREEREYREPGTRRKEEEEGGEHWRTFVLRMFITCGTRRGKKIKLFYRDIYWIWTQSRDMVEERRESMTCKLRDKKAQVGQRH